VRAAYSRRRHGHRGHRRRRHPPNGWATTACLYWLGTAAKHNNILESFLRTVSLSSVHSSLSLFPAARSTLPVIQPLEFRSLILSLSFFFSLPLRPTVCLPVHMRTRIQGAAGIMGSSPPHRTAGGILFCTYVVSQDSCACGFDEL
jgi:hypothetical protein